MRKVVVGVLVAWSVTAVGCGDLAALALAAALGELDGGSGGGSSWNVPAEPAMSPGASSSLAFLNGTESGNVFCYWVGAGSWDYVYKYADGETPTGIVSTGAGIVTSTPTTLRRRNDDFLVPEDFDVVVGEDTQDVEFGLVTSSGPDVIVVVSTPDESLLVRVDAGSGILVDYQEPRLLVEISGMTVMDDHVIVAEAPTGDIVAYDLRNLRREPTLLVDGADLDGQPAGMTVGANGNLFVAMSDEPVVHEIDVSSGLPVDSFRIREPGIDGVEDIVYDEAGEVYLVTAGTSAILELDDDGEVVGRHEQEHLDGAATITLVER